MSTISVPLSEDLEKFINAQVKSGHGANKAAVVRRALVRMAEEEAINTILRAQEEPTLRGDLKKLAKKF